MADDGKRTPSGRVFDVEHWPRREHYQYYTERIPISYSLTADVDVERAIEICRAHGRRFYPYVIAASTRTVNELPFLRMYRDDRGRLCVWDDVCPNYTIFHDDDKTFSDCWSPYDEDPAAFYGQVARDMAAYGDVHGIKAREGQPPNFFCVSMVPWVAFTGYATTTINQADTFFPIVTCGKYVPRPDTEGGFRRVMPVTLTISHAVCDGWHAGQFFETLRRELDRDIFSEEGAGAEKEPRADAQKGDMR